MRGSRSEEKLAGEIDRGEVRGLGFSCGREAASHPTTPHADETTVLHTVQYP